MIEGFDKEIDALLRQTVKGKAAPVADNSKSQTSNPKFVHLDADEISAFAESVLPEKTRVKYTAHFANCDRCRIILSNIISLNSETKAVSDSSVVSPEIVKAANIPWYRRLLTFPNPAYALGVLVVLLGGFLAFSILQNGNDSQSAEISQISENQQTASGPNAEIETDFSTTGTMSNTNMTSTNMSTMATSSNSAMVSSSNASTMMNVNNNAEQRLNTNLGTSNTTSAKREATLNEVKREEEKTVTEDDSAMRQTVPTAGSATGDQVLNRQAAEVSADNEKSRIAGGAPPPAAIPNPAAREKAENKDKRLAKNINAEQTDRENKQIGGKTFNRRDGVWYDSAYNGQSTTNVSRGSDEYKKLDSGLRSIADNLSGTVVIVWKNKVYRVQ